MLTDDAVDRLLSLPADECYAVLERLSLAALTEVVLKNPVLTLAGGCELHQLDDAGCVTVDGVRFGTDGETMPPSDAPAS